MVANFIACDKDSSDCFTRTIRTDSLETLQECWTEFKNDVPFGRWYSDNTMDEGTPEEEAALADLD